MPFAEVNIKNEIEKRRNSDPEFRKAWDDSRLEYKLLGELVKMRNEQGLTQEELAKKAGTSQQRISRIEKHEQTPNLKTLCSLVRSRNA